MGAAGVHAVGITGAAPLRQPGKPHDSNDPPGSAQANEPSCPQFGHPQPSAPAARKKRNSNSPE